MSGDGTYQASPQELRRAVTRLQSLPENVNQMLDTFRSLRSDFEGWNGRDDDYYEKTQPEWEKANEACENFLIGLQSSLGGLVSGTLTSLGSIEGTKGYVDDVIHDANTSLDSVLDEVPGGDGDQAGSGGGKH